MEERRGFKELLNHLGFQKEGGGGVTADSARTAKKNGADSRQNTCRGQREVRDVALCPPLE